jgi:ADP-ribose pyrophosphatase YjhB (NUDIX family)/FMN phosphatase YigB (HAD superfamily)
MKTAIVLDWDGVVFDDDAYKAELFKNIGSLGISETDIAQAYEQSKDLNGYNDRKLAQYLADKTTSLTFDEALTSIDLVMSETKARFIYSDIITFLDNTQTQRIDLYILTAGDARIQTAKYINSGLAKYFTDIIIVSADTTALGKEKRLSELLNHYESIYFYDDKPATILHLHEVFRDTVSLVPILVDRYEQYGSPWSNGFCVTALKFDDIAKFSSFYKKPRTLVSANRIQKDDSVLLVYENAGRASGTLSLPMGHVDSGQLFLEAAEREAEEESGYETQVLRFRRLIAVDGAHYLGSDYDLNRTVIVVTFDSTITSQARHKKFEFKSEWIKLSTINTRKLRGDWHESLLL